MAESPQPSPGAGRGYGFLGFSENLMRNLYASPSLGFAFICWWIKELVSSSQSAPLLTYEIFNIAGGIVLHGNECHIQEMITVAIQLGIIADQWGQFEVNGHFTTGQNEATRIDDVEVGGRCGQRSGVHLVDGFVILVWVGKGNVSLDEMREWS